MLSPEMGLLGDSCKKVTNDSIALIHLYIYQMYLSMLSDIFAKFVHFSKRSLVNDHISAGLGWISLFAFNKFGIYVQMYVN